MELPSTILSQAVDALATLPGVGRRSALRYALHLMKEPEGEVLHLAESLSRLKTDLRTCRLCHCVSDSDLCPICSSPKRQQNVICVVENVQDVMAIENTQQYQGLYHVLGGVISPIDGIGPSDLTIRQLVDRLHRLTGSSGLEDCPVEVILALSGDVEGETTAFYIYRQIADLGVKVSTLARGLGFGDDLEYADALTLGRSIVNRQEFKP